MKTVALTFLILLFCSAVFADYNEPITQQKVFPIHDGKRELKHERGGKLHDFRKLHQRKHRDSSNHIHQRPRHRMVR